MSKQEILEFLIDVMNYEIQEEFKTTDHKDYIEQCIASKRWLKYQQSKDGMMRFLADAECFDDYQKYVNGDIKERMKYETTK